MYLAYLGSSVKTTIVSLFILPDIWLNWRDAFHSTQNFGNFGWYIMWNGPCRFGSTGIFGTIFEGIWQNYCPQYRSFVSCLLRVINQTQGGLGRVCATVCTVPLDTRNFRNFKPQFLLNEKCTRSKFWCRLSENPWLASLIYSIYYLHKHHTFVKHKTGQFPRH